MDSNITNEERAKAFKFCNKYLDGVWKVVSSSNVSISKLSGGMSNLLYYCALSDTVEIHDKEPKEVLLRFYGPSHGDTDLQLEIFNKLASENLGPLLYSSFEEGRFEEYLPSSPLSWAHLTKEDISAVIARKLAAIHKLNIQSLKSDANWLIDKYNQLYKFLENLRENPPEFSNEILESTKTIAMGLIAIDFRKEIDYLESLLQNSNAPLVFSHNDLHQNNILLLHDKDDGQSLDDRIVLIDFEYCSYNYRTFDIANHLCEWCFDYNGEDYPYFSSFINRFPSEEEQRQFLSHYASEISDIEEKEDSRADESSPKNKNGIDDDQRMDEIDILFNEMQPLLMASNVLWTLWAIQSACTSKIKFGFWEMAKCKWDIYLLCKQRFIDRSRKNNLGCEGDLTVQSSKL